MIKTITERSLHGVIQKMKAEGVSLKDTEGFGINVDSSGHTYVVYMGEESETGVIDTSAGEAGVSAWINPTLSTTPANPTSYIEIGVVQEEVAYGAETLTHVSGNSWSVTLAGAANDYIKPRTFFVEATDSAPELVDDGLGLVRVNDLDRRAVGTIDYETGAVSITYYADSLSPNSASSPRVKYFHSPLPNTSVFPKVVALSHIVFVTSSQNGHLHYELYNNIPSSTSPYQAPCVFQHNNLSPQRLDTSGDYMVEDFCDSRISICLNTDVNNRQKRWMKVTATSNDIIKAVYVYWNRLSS